MKTPLALCALYLSISVAAQTPLYRVVEGPTGGPIIALNQHGEYLFGGGPGAPGRGIVGRNGTFMIPPITGPGAFTMFVGMTLTDDGEILGHVANPTSPYANVSFAAMWNPQQGLQVCTVSAWGATAIGRAPNGGRVLINGTTSWTTPGDLPLFWHPGGATYSVPHGDFGRAVGMDAAGNALIEAGQNGHQNRIVRTDNSVVLLQSDGRLYPTSISSNGHVVSVDHANSPYYGPRLHYIHRPDGTVLQTIWLDAPVTEQNRSVTLFSINSRLEGVGTGPLSGYRAVYWSAMTGLVDLQTRLTADSSSWILLGAETINDRGEILAVVRKENWEPFVTKQVLLQPVPEPATLTALAVGLVACLRRKRTGKS